MKDLDKKLDEIKGHWEGWANEFGSDLRATTRSSNIKKLEIKALIRAISQLKEKPKNILEVGCGNGINAVSIAQELDCHVDGFDFISEMIDSANLSLNEMDGGISNRIKFFVDDVLNFSAHEPYELVYSCRCLINLPSWDLQKKALKNTLSNLQNGGHYLMLENFSDAHCKQNSLREKVGLESRKVADFNLFFNKELVIDYLRKEGVDLVEEYNFSSLHDIAQYVLVPMINSGKVDYNHEVMQAITEMLLSSNVDNEFGDFGQNKLLIFRKKIYE